MKFLDFIALEAPRKSTLIGVEGDSFLLQLGVEQWCQKTGLTEREHVLVDKKTTVADIAERILEIPLFSSGKILIFEQVQEMDKKELESLIVFLESEGGFEQNRLVFTGSWRKNSVFLKRMKEHADIFWGDVTERDMGDYLKWRQQELEAPLTGRYQSWLTSRLQEDFRKIDLVMSQWSQIQSTSAVVTGEEDKLFLSLLPKTSHEETYQLTGAIREKKVGRALQLLNLLLLQGQSEFSLLGYLASYIGGLLQVKGLAASGLNAREIADKLGRRSDYPIKKNLEELPSWSSRELEDMFERLERVEVKIRQGQDARFLMELLVIAMCSRKGGGKRGRN